MTTFLAAYIRAALWSTNDESDASGGEPLDQNYAVTDIAKETLDKMVIDCACFQAENQDDLEGEDEEQTAHDFWLTRNGHGAGFWDGDYEEEKGKRLTESSKRFGEVNLYVGDDGKIYS
jgi:hypothetical protein